MSARKGRSKKAYSPREGGGSQQLLCLSLCWHSHFSLTSRVNGPQDRVWESKVPPTAIEDQVRDHLRNLNIHQSIRLDKTHPIVLRELVEVVAKPVSMVLEKSWLALFQFYFFPRNIGLKAMLSISWA